jgi:hypothetical protein
MATFLVYEPRPTLREVLVQRLVGVGPPDGLTAGERLIAERAE